jgi:SAM-dependent methyltransferase
MSKPDTRALRPPLADHFVKASLLGWLRRRHPYDFIETYHILERVYGYQRAYVNLGLWDDGEHSVEAGQKLAFVVLDSLRLSKGDYLVDAGSGLGQGAVDAIERYDLGRVHAINTNTRQLAYAGELAVRAGVDDRIVHAPADACATIEGLGDGTVAGVSAIECIGHFGDPLRFFRGAYDVLRPGGRLAFCLNVAARPFGWWPRRMARWSYGFVPEAIEAWTGRLETARLEAVEVTDLTERVLAPMTRVVGARLQSGNHRDLSWMIRRMMRWQLRTVANAVAEGSLRYLLVVAERP